MTVTGDAADGRPGSTPGAVEVERTFRVDRLPAERSGPVEIEQGYLAIDGDVEVRVRRKGSSPGVHLMTVKAGRGLERTEIEFEIDGERGSALLALADDRRIVKRRSTIRLGDHLAELDEFGGALDGLCLVEVEFPDRATADDFDPPDWFGAEVTDDDRWSNRELARHGRPAD